MSNIFYVLQKIKSLPHYKLKVSANRYAVTQGFSNFFGRDYFQSLQIFSRPLTVNMINRANTCLLLV